MSIILYAAPVPRTDYSPLTGSLIISAVAPGRNDKDCILTESLPGLYHAVHSPFAVPETGFTLYNDGIHTMLLSTKEVATIAENR